MKSIVIGSGFGGISAALRLKAKNHNVTLIEKRPFLGGRARVFKKNDFKNGAFIFIKKAMSLTVLTAIFYIVSLYFLSNYYQLNDAILKIIFIGLASLTFPHILLEYILDKNEK